ncbi:nuclear-pore anchor-like [Impatiens glandulifera]|uniref:nuclear-pore anchor-like n=1 Tax=Impatiens glandulifera TaxID=253017 RepID=UPI001FB076CA|nr:nuclear-pore anchor-like [Impatiens glandulifera]
MPLFLTDEEFDQCSNDASLVSEKADSFIRQLYAEHETVKAMAAAASITAEQTCSILEQKYVSLSSEFNQIETQNAQLNTTLEQRLSDLTQVQAEKHQALLKCIAKDGDIERLSTEVTELHKSKSQLMELIEHKDTEISEKNATIKSYHEKIVNLNDSAAIGEAKLNEIVVELARCRGSFSRLSQEKELIEKHNNWLNDELSTKVNSFTEVRMTQSDVQADMSAKIADLEKKLNDSMISLNRNKDRSVELEIKLSSLQEELTAARDVAAANEEQFTAELSTVNKLVGLYKESSEEWSQKAGELEGVIKALDTHLDHVNNDYKERLEKETSAKLMFEKETAHLKEKLQKCEAEIEANRKASELNLLPLSSVTMLKWGEIAEEKDTVEDNRQIVPSIPVGVSGTTLAVSLLRDGWSLGKMYTKYQEAVDALKHEQLDRKQTQAVLERVFYEIEDKAAVILHERAEHEKLTEAYAVVNQKLQHYLVERTNLEKTIQELRVELMQHQRHYTTAHKEIVDLQKQVAVLLEECRDVQLQCGASGIDSIVDHINIPYVELNADSEVDRVISERLLTYKDISGLVEQNVRLRSIVRSLSDQLEVKEGELKEKFEMEFQKQNEEASFKVNEVLMRAEQQERMIESLHTSVSMYKRLYEEGNKLHLSNSQVIEAAPEDGKRDLMLILEGSKASVKKAQEATSDHVKWLEENVGKLRTELISVQSERDKLALEVNFARENLERSINEVEHQRDETKAIVARNVELSQLINGYERRVRESSESMHNAEDLSRKLTIEVSILKHAKEMLLGSEKKATEEVLCLSERVHRLQASLDIIQSAEEVREESRRAEKRKQEEHIMHIEKECAEAKKELQEERNNVRRLMLDREEIMKSAMRQVEETGKELTNSLNTVAAAEARASAAEAQCFSMEKNKSGEVKVCRCRRCLCTILTNISLSSFFQCNAVTSIYLGMFFLFIHFLLWIQVTQSGSDQGLFSSSNEAISDLQAAREEIQKLREEAQANKDHILHYKNIATVHDEALKQMELVHENFKTEADRVKQSLELQILSFKNKIDQLETEYSLKSTEVVSLVAEKESSRASCFLEIDRLKMECALKTSQITEMGTKILALKEDLDKEHQRWRDAQSNYERQVILQSETIQELNKTSIALESLQGEASEHRKLVDTLKTENNALKTRWEIEKSIMEKSKNYSEMKFREIDEQNKILHNRLEALHIKLAEKERSLSGVSSGSSDQDRINDNGLQSIVNYLRPSKEIAETEISLLKKEKLRLQSQLESALNAGDTAQASLHAERANSRTSLLTEEEFKSLQLQVRELNLLRESNLQLREENKQNFEECQKLNVMAQNAIVEKEHLEDSLRVRQTEFEVYKKDAEMLKGQKDLLESRVHELLERCQDIDMEDYAHAKEAVQQMQANISSKEGELVEIRKLLCQKDASILQLESELATSITKVNEKESRLNKILQVESTMKLDLEKQKKTVIQLKRKIDSLSKEKDDLSKEKQAMSKQLEECKQGLKSDGEAAGEQVMKEKDTKIQILEKTVERQREELKKEKERDREKCQNAEKTVLENLVTSSQALENFDYIAHSVSSGYGTPVVDLPQKVDASSTSVVINTGEPVPPVTASLSILPAPVCKQSEEKLLRRVPKQSIIESRKSVRRLVRPQMSKREEQSLGGDTEMSEIEGTSQDSMSSAPSLESHGVDSGVQNTVIARKRAATSTSDLSDLSLHRDVMIPYDEAMPSLKKLRGSNLLPQEAAAMESQPATENSEAIIIPSDAGGVVVPQEELNDETFDEIGGISDEQEEEEAKEGGGDMMNQLELHEDTLVGGDNNNQTELDTMVPTEEVDVQQQLGLETDSDQEEGELPSSDHDEDLDDNDVGDNNATSDAMEKMNEVTEEAGSPHLEVDKLDVTPTAILEEETARSKIPKQGGTSEKEVVVIRQQQHSPLRERSEVQETRQQSPISRRQTTINLRERAKEAAMIRQQGLSSSSSQGPRGRGRLNRARGGRGQPPHSGGGQS